MGHDLYPPLCVAEMVRGQLRCKVYRCKRNVFSQILVDSSRSQLERFMDTSNGFTQGSKIDNVDKSSERRPVVASQALVQAERASLSAL